MDIDVDSIYGDGWYDGFLCAKKIATDTDTLSTIEDCSEGDVLEMSERAEVDQRTKRNRWTQESPIKQGLYWHWSGNKGDTPIVLSVLYSDTKKECFVHKGQYGIEQAVYCSEYGGYWASCPEPETPEL